MLICKNNKELFIDYSASPLKNENEIASGIVLGFRESQQSSVLDSVY